MSVALLGALLWWLDADEVAARLSALRPGWVLAALAIAVPQMALLALRWRVTAGKLGIDLPFRAALEEYWLGVFLNQVLPGGVTGDVARAWRHASSAGPGAAPSADPGAAGGAAGGDAPGAAPEAGDGAPRAARHSYGEQARARVSGGSLGPALRAVILERASAQVVMGAVAALALASTPLAFGVGTGTVLLALLGAGAVVALGVVALGVAAARYRVFGGAIGSLWVALWQDARRGVLAPDVVGFQLASAALVVASYLATYLVAARAVGVETPMGTLLPLVPPVLLSMLLPVTIAGWGVREATAAGVWSAVGASAEDAVAISACYGLLVLMGSLPGALVLLRARRGGGGAGGGACGG